MMTHAFLDGKRQCSSDWKSAVCKYTGMPLRAKAISGGFSFIILFGLLFSCAVFGQTSSNELTFTPLDTRAVHIKGEIGRRIDLTIKNNIEKIDNEQVFLKSFSQQNRKKSSYVGMGKHIDALVRLAYHTGDPKLTRLKNSLVTGLIDTQSSSGYIGVFNHDRMKSLWDVHEGSYIILGLVSDYRFFGHRYSLESARRLADFMMNTRPAKPLVFHVSTIGLERAFIALYQATGEKKYLDYVNVDNTLRSWQNKVGGHAYDYLNLCMAQLDLYRLSPDASLLKTSRGAVDYMLRGGGMAVMGTGSQNENWHSDVSSSPDFGETCFTGYWIRTLHTLIQIGGESRYGDLMERAILNALFACQSTSGRELFKYVPFQGVRHPYKGEPSSDNQRDAYCCPNNFRRAIAELPDMIAYQTTNGVALNLYTASSVCVPLDQGVSVELRQETDYPTSGNVIIHVEPSQPASFALHLRIPRWCDAPLVQINGKAVTGVRSGAFAVLHRKWSSGDRVSLSLQMKIRLVRGRLTQAEKVSILRGPIVYCLDPVAQSGHPRNDWQEVCLALASVEGPLPDATVRPGGTALSVKAWSPKQPRTSLPDLNLRLTEYADPGGQAAYFNVDDSGGATEDELLTLPESSP